MHAKDIEAELRAQQNLELELRKALESPQVPSGDTPSQWEGRRTPAENSRLARDRIARLPVTTTKSERATAHLCWTHLLAAAQMQSDSVREATLNNLVDAFLQLPPTDTSDTIFRQMWAYADSSLRDRLRTVLEARQDSRRSQSLLELGDATTLPKRPGYSRSSFRWLALASVVCALVWGLSVYFAGSTKRSTGDLPVVVHPSQDVKPKTSLLIAKLAVLGAPQAKGDAVTVHSGDDYTFNAEAVTSLQYGYLLGVDDEAIELRDSSQNHSGKVFLKFNGTFDQRECFEFLVVVLVNTEQPVLTQTRPSWWTPETIGELQRAGSQQDAEKQVESVLRRSLRDAGVKEFDVQFWKYTHKRESRVRAST